MFYWLKTVASRALAWGTYVRICCVIFVASLSVKLCSSMKTATQGEAPKVILFQSDYYLFPVQTKAVLLRP
jgi:hypothetical protein